MPGQTILLNSHHQRSKAKALIDAAPMGAVVNVREATRSTDQNAKMWAMLSDVSRSMPGGRRHTTDVWKALFMHACGHQVQFMDSLEGGTVFPVGFKSSRLTVGQMADLITFIQAWGDEKGVEWTEQEAGDSMNRQEFTKRTKAAVFTRENGRCERCTRKVGTGGEPAEFHHRVTCEDGGDNNAENCELLCSQCHSHQTHKIEAPAKAEGRRHQLKQAGIPKQSRNPLPGSKASGWKRRVDGTVVRRE